MTDRPRPEERRSATTGGEFARMVQGVILERFTIGVILMGLVDLAAAFLEGHGAARVGAAVIGVLGLVVAGTALRRHWPDSAMWAVCLVLAAAELGAFAWAVAG